MKRRCNSYQPHPHKAYCLYRQVFVIEILFYGNEFALFHVHGLVEWAVCELLSLGVTQGNLDFNFPLTLVEYRFIKLRKCVELPNLSI